MAAWVTAKNIFRNDHASKMLCDSGGFDSQESRIGRIWRQKDSDNSLRANKFVRNCPFCNLILAVAPATIATFP
jgi:hypothetical protein